ncbi:hypothetical protein FQN54_004468 [Arachnomyces sp. PD_36]|nr:hypothetical protein FQN54_004468 [Arachnomyces sp. PD_36]
MIVEVESIFENTPNVRVEFLNGGKIDAQLATPANVHKLLGQAQYQGATKLGEALRDRILNDRRTEGAVVNDCGHLSSVSSMMGSQKESIEINVLFQISRVGGDKQAKQYLQSLSQDAELRRIVRCTSYMDLDVDNNADEKIEQYADAIQTLAGAALTDFDVYREDDWSKAGID